MATDWSGSAGRSCYLTFSEREVLTSVESPDSRSAELHHDSCAYMSRRQAGAFGGLTMGLARRHGHSRAVRHERDGSLLLDPNDATGKHDLCWNCETNASGDSEAGVGIYKTTDGGNKLDVRRGSDIFFQRAIGRGFRQNGNLLVSCEWRPWDKLG